MKQKDSASRETMDDPFWNDVNQDRLTAAIADMETRTNVVTKTLEELRAMEVEQGNNE